MRPKTEGVEPMRFFPSVGRIMLLGGAVFAAIMPVNCTNRKERLSDGIEQPIRVSVEVDTALYRTLYHVYTIGGMLEAYREAECAPVQAGRVRSLPFNIGDYVKAGQVVARLDDAQLIAAIAQFQPLKSQYDRAVVLHQSGAMSAAQFESIEAQYISLKRQVEFLQENTVIKAPFSGIVTARACEEGELYSPPMVPSALQSRGLIRITQLDPLKLDLSIDDKTVGHIHKGQDVSIVVYIRSDSTVKTSGRIEWVNPQAEKQSNTFRVRVVVPNPARVLKPGYFAEVKIILATRENALSVPHAAVVENRVYVVRNGIAYMHSVKLGWTKDNTYVEIDSGIDANSIVVISGNKALPDSSQVQISAL